MKKIFGASLVLLCLGLVSVAQATTTVSATFETPVNVQTSVCTSRSSNSPGPTITLQGALSLGGVGVKLLFENNVIGTHTHTVASTATATLSPPGPIVPTPQPPAPGPGASHPYTSLHAR